LLYAFCFDFDIFPLPSLTTAGSPCRVRHRSKQLHPARILRPGRRVGKPIFFNRSRKTIMLFAFVRLPFSRAIPSFGGNRRIQLWFQLLARRQKKKENKQGSSPRLHDKTLLKENICSRVSTRKEHRTRQHIGQGQRQEKCESSPFAPSPLPCHFYSLDCKGTYPSGRAIRNATSAYSPHVFSLKRRCRMHQMARTRIPSRRIFFR
jgi:hypothetical protein